MINNEISNALKKWIMDWKKTYGDYPSFDECLSWINWKFDDFIPSKNEIDLIEEILKNIEN